MSTKHRKFIFTFVAAICVSSTLLAQAPASSRGSYVPIAITVQAALGIPTGTQDISSVLLEADAAYKKGNVDEIAASLERIVRAFNAGANPEAFQKKSLAAISIPTYASYASRAVDPAFAASVQRNQIAKTLLAKAVALGPKDPAAPRYARAALLLSAYEDMILGEGALGYIGRDFARVRPVTGLTDAQATELQQTLLRLNQAAALSSQNNAAASYARDLMRASDNKHPAPKKTWEASLAYSTAAMEAARGYHGLSFVVIQDVWALRNIGIARGNKDLVTSVDQVLDGWASEFDKDAVERRWLTEAKTAIAPPPDRATVRGLDQEPAAKAELERQLEDPPLALLESLRKKVSN